jgi:hypothetical protein
MKGYQIVWWLPHWIGVGFTCLEPAVTDMAYLYDWYLCLGFVEIRKRTKRKLTDIKLRTSDAGNSSNQYP